MSSAPSGKRPAVLTVVDHYWPGFKAGGPVRTIMSLVEHLGSEFLFDIVTSDRDLGDRRAYDGITANRWTVHGDARVLYLSRLRRTIVGWWWLLRRSSHDAWYFNSLFSRNTIKVLLLRRVALLPATPMVLAPRGELQQGALSIKPRRKKVFLHWAHAVDLFSGVVFQASNVKERLEIVQTLEAHGWTVTPTVRAAPNLARAVRVEVGADLPMKASRRATAAVAAHKRAGAARMVFLSRLSRMKNLDGALRVLGRLRGEVSLDIYGPIEDPGYWAECRALIERLPDGIRASYRGVVEPDKVGQVFSAYDLFLFPSRGENYGHVVIEALLAGCPVLTTDRTPWASLEASLAGWCLALEDESGFVARAQRVVDMDGETLERMRAAARCFAGAVVSDQAAVDANRDLFQRVLRA